MAATAALEHPGSPHVHVAVARGDSAGVSPEAHASRVGGPAARARCGGLDVRCDESDVGAHRQTSTAVVNAMRPDPADVPLPRAPDDMRSTVVNDTYREG